MKMWDLRKTSRFQSKITEKFETELSCLQRSCKGLHLGQSQKKQMGNQLIRSQSKTMQLIPRTGKRISHDWISLPFWLNKKGN